MQYNIFNQVHLPLKLSLLNASIYLNRFENFYSQESFAHILSKVGKAADTFKMQLRFEEFFILPMVFEYEPSIAAKYTNDHGKQTAILLELENSIEIFKDLPHRFKSLSSIKLFNEGFNSFILNNYHHMDEEEEVLNIVLRTYYSDNYLKLIEQNLKSDQSVVPGNLKQNSLLPAKAA